MSFVGLIVGVLFGAMLKLKVTVDRVEERLVDEESQDEVAKL